MKDYKIECIEEQDSIHYVFNRNEKNVYLNSIVSSKKEMLKFVGNLSNDNFNIIIGIGNGTLIEELSTFKNIHNLVIEPFNDIKLNEQQKDMLIQNNNISFYYYDELTPLIINSYIQRFSGLETNIQLHPHYDKTDITLMNEIILDIKNALTMMQVNKNTEHFFQKDWIIEPVLNLPFTTKIPLINEMKDQFKGETAFLVSSGPSLKEQIDFVKKNKENAYIFAAGSAINGLLSNGVEPDFVSVIDSSFINFTAHFQGSNYSGPLIVSGMANSKIVENHKGSFFLADLNLDSITKRYRESVDTFPAVPSVAVFTLQVIYYLGFSKVYMIGQDLALTNGNYYSEGVKVHQGTNQFESQLMVDSNNGDKVGTLYSLYSHLQSFNDLISLLDTEKMQIYNLSKHGAKIKGTKYIDVNEVSLTTKRNKKQDNCKMEFSIDDAMIFEFVEELMLIEKETSFLLNRLKKFNTAAINLEDLKRILKIFKKFREIDLIENVLLNQLSFYVQIINNKFEFLFEEKTINNENRLEMVRQIIKLVELTNTYVNELLVDDRFIKFKSV